MIVSIVGGHGSIARQLTRLLVARGHRVRGIVRNDDQFGDLRADGAEPVLCDLEQATSGDVDDALRGSDLVVFAAGAGPDSGPDRKQSLDRDGAIKSVDSAVRIGAGRFVIISSMGADEPPDDDETFSVYLRAKAAADDAVREAHIDAIVVRPGRLTDDDPTRTVDIGAKVDRGEIPRADVAAVLAELVEVADGVNTTIEVVSGSLPIRNAVAQLL
ncbi:MAG: SDR family oxidoreductase [Ilumatobacteraceae bacterium]|nr:SDR family oxidoreductase [Ilumatobacteraceae bacterium]